MSVAEANKYIKFEVTPVSTVAPTTGDPVLSAATGIVVSTNANLSALTISEGTLTPTFAASTTSYTDQLGIGTSSITVTPTVEDAKATITVNGTAVQSGTASGSITMNLGDNTITIIVTATDGTSQKTYTIVATRGLTAQQVYLKGADTDADDRFGRSVSISGDSIVVGAWYEDSNATGVINGTGGSSDNSKSASGAGYVFY